jgi:hypothetical protein
MKTTTLAELVVSAQLAANKAAAPNADGTVKDLMAIETLRLEEFANTGFDREDYSTWQNTFLNQLEMHVNFGKQDSPATTAAKKAAAAANAKI